MCSRACCGIPSLISDPAQLPGSEAPNSVIRRVNAASSCSSLFTLVVSLARYTSPPVACGRTRENVQGVSRINRGRSVKDQVEQGREGRAVLVQELDAAWRLLADRMAEAGANAPVRLVSEDDGRIKLAVDRLEAIGEPESLTRLRETAAAMLPRIDLPDLLLEVHGWTGFLDEYTHVGERGPRMNGLAVSVAALLVAEACNVGLTGAPEGDYGPLNPLARHRLARKIFHGQRGAPGR